MPDNPLGDEPGRTPPVILDDLAAVIGAWFDVIAHTMAPAAANTFLATPCYLGRVPDLLRELGAAIGPGYDFDAWISDLADKATPEAADLAGKIWAAIDNLAGAG